MNIIKKSFLSLILSSAICSQANALDVIFPQSSFHKTWMPTTYVMGNVKEGAELLINDVPVKVWDNGAYCHILNLEDGEKEYKLTETYKDEEDNIVTNEKFLKIKKIPSAKKTVTYPKSAPNSFKKVHSYTQPDFTKYENPKFGYILNDNSPARSYPSTNGDRITHLPQKTVVLIEGEYKDWYKIQTNAEPLWIYQNNVKILYPLDKELFVSIRRADIFEDTEFSYLQLTLDIPVPFKTEEVNDDIELTIWGIYDIEGLKTVFNRQQNTNFKIKSFENNTLTITIPNKNGSWGHYASYDSYTLIFKQRKNPIIFHKTPIKGLTIAVDAGHGGSDKGTIGPTRIYEKDVNLAISLYLQKELEKRGANVIMTRTTDTDVEIYSRPKKALDENAAFSISVHSNSMVDGNPLERHGVSVFWYNEHAQRLADTIKTTMAESLNLRNDGTHYASFVLTRPTMPISVLVEVGYMPNPDEYKKLTNPKFQRQAAKAIADGLEKYLKSANSKAIIIEEDSVFLPHIFKRP